MRLRYITYLLLSGQLAYANAFAQWGIANSTRESSDKSQIKFVEFGKSGEEGKLAYTVGIGGWHDSTGYVNSSGVSFPSVNTPKFQMKGGELEEKARDSAFVEALFGVEPKSDHMYVTYKLGPAIITHTDCMLGSNIQIGHEFGIGMRDYRDVRVGLVLKHFSNAGIVRPNLGRDFVGMRIEF